MPITISDKDYWDLACQARQKKNLNHDDLCEVIYQYPEQLGQGIYREVQLRSGIELEIDRYQLHDDVIVQSPARSHSLEYVFGIAGKSTPTSISPGQYLLCGSGIAPMETYEQSAIEPIVQVSVHIEPEVFQSFFGDKPNGMASLRELASLGLGHLVRESDLYYQRYGVTTVAMQTVLHQILHCSFQGITKKIYLESKVWELMALLIEEEKERHQHKQSTFALKPDDVDRIHHAKDILTQQIDNPPLLLDLARQVGLNDCTFKRGFREVFGTTAFGYLHDYRLEQARQLLQQRELNVSQVAKKVGYASQSRFASAFRKKFGVNPKAFMDCT